MQKKKFLRAEIKEFNLNSITFLNFKHKSSHNKVLRLRKKVSKVT